MVGSNIVHVRWHDRSSGRLLTGVARREKICRIRKPCLRPEDEISQFLAPAWQGYMYPGSWPLCLRHRLMSRAPSCYKIERTGVVGAEDLGHYPGYGFQNPPVPHPYPTCTPPVPHSRKSAGGRTPPVPQPYPTCTPTVPQLGFSIEPDRAGFLILFSKIKPVRSS